MKKEQSVPKRRQRKFRRREITQKKTYNIQDTAKVWNQEHTLVFVPQFDTTDITLTSGRCKPKHVVEKRPSNARQQVAR